VVVSQQDSNVAHSAIPLYGRATRIVVPWRRLHAEYSAELSHAFLHADQPQPGMRHLRTIETYTVVCYREFDLVAMIEQADTNLLGARAWRSWSAPPERAGTRDRAMEALRGCS
jgi:hypothetical protein